MEVIKLKHPFLLGALGYPLLELLYRGRTHYSMAIAGGLSTLWVNMLRRKPGGLGRKSLLSALGITAIELTCGYIWNGGYRIWDYRHLPLNWQGQICLPYTLLWCGLSAGLIRSLDLLEKHKSPDSM